MARFPLFLLALLSSSVLAHELAAAGQTNDRPHMARLRRRSVSSSPLLALRDGGAAGDLLGGVAQSIGDLTGQDGTDSSDSGTDSTGSSTDSTGGSTTDSSGTSNANGPAGGGGDNTGGGDSSGAGNAGGDSGANSVSNSNSASDSAATPSASNSGASTSGDASTSGGASTSGPASSSSSTPPPTSTPANTNTGPVIITSTTSTSSSAATSSSSAAAASSGGGGGMGKPTIMAIGIVGGVVVGGGLLWTIIRKTRFGTSKRFNEKLNPIDFGEEVPFPATGALHRTDSIGSSVSRTRDEKSDWGGRGGGSDWGGSQRGGIPSHGRNGSGGTEYTSAQAPRGYAPPQMGYGAPYGQQPATYGAYAAPQGRSLVGMDGIPRQGTQGYPYPPQQPTLPNPYDAYAGLQAQQSVRRAPSPNPGNQDPYYRGGY